MNLHDREYLDLLREILTEGEPRPDRTGVGVRSLFGRRMQFNLARGFPLITTKYVWFGGVVHELLWFLRGETNIRALQERKVHIWDEWADDNGELGPVYGAQWRGWSSWRTTIDQITGLVDGLKRDPFSRRHILSAWNVAEIPAMALPPCHVMAQWYVSRDRRLSCQLYQRSADAFLGLPWNIASYALLTHMLAYVCGFEVGIFTHVLGDVHLYENHIQHAEEQLTRFPYEAPILVLSGPKEGLDDWGRRHVRLMGYDHHAAIRAEVAV